MIVEVGNDVDSTCSYLVNEISMYAGVDASIVVTPLTQVALTLT